MANEIVKTDDRISRNKTPIEIFVGKVLPVQDRDALRAQLPAHVNWERFERNLQNALIAAPALLQCDPRAVFREVAKIAALGLYIDPQLGEAYLIASRTGPQARIGYRGLIKLGKQSGEVASLYAHEVRRNDKVTIDLGTEKKITHVPAPLGDDRGDVVGYYAVIVYLNGAKDFEVMDMPDIYRIRDRSDGYKAYVAKKISSTPWVSDEGEMSKKTVLRRLSKRIPQSPDLADALSIEDRAEFPDMGAIAYERKRSDLMAQLEAGRQRAEGVLIDEEQQAGDLVGGNDDQAGELLGGDGDQPGDGRGVSGEGDLPVGQTNDADPVGGEAEPPTAGGLTAKQRTRLKVAYAALDVAVITKRLDAVMATSEKHRTSFENEPAVLAEFDLMVENAMARVRESKP